MSDPKTKPPITQALCAKYLIEKSDEASAPITFVAHDNDGPNAIVIATLVFDLTREEIAAKVQRFLDDLLPECKKNA